MADNFLDIGIPDIDETIEIRERVSYKLGVNIKSSNDLRKFRKLQAALDSAAAALVPQLQQSLQAALAANIWPDGSGGTDDIISSGALLRSQSVNYSNSQIRIDYDVPYAALVHYGGYIRPYGRRDTAAVYIAPRPWVAGVLSGKTGLNLRAEYQRLIDQIISSL